VKSLPNPVRKVNAHVLGLDVHKMMIAWVLLDRKGAAKASGEIPADPVALAALVREQIGRKKAHAAFEASGCSLWVFDQLVTLLKGAEFVHVAHAKDVRAIANSKHKNDHNDAWWLAYLTYEGRLPEVWLPTGKIRDLRLVTRERMACVQERTRMMKRIRAHLRQAGVGRTLRPAGLSHRNGRALTRQWAAELGGQLQLAIEHGLARIEALDLEVGFWEERIAELAEALPEVGHLSKEMPGIGLILAATVVAESGSFSRFPHPKAYARCTGLTPAERSSAGHQHYGSITKEGSPALRWALVQAVMGCLRCKNGPGVNVGHWVRGMQKKLGSKKKGQVAGARKLAEAIWRLFALGECFDLRKPFGPLPAAAAISVRKNDAA
jgi:transposase